MEAKKFGRFFKKLRQHSDSNEDVKTAWSAILPHTEDDAMNDIKTLTNAWFNSVAATWSKAVEVESKKASLKGDEGNLISVMTSSKSPLKEFAETSYRYRSAEFEVLMRT